MFSRLRAFFTSRASHSGTDLAASSASKSVACNASGSDDGLEKAVIKQLIVGLGNPGKKYSETRHNVGFLVVDRLAERGGAPFTPHLKWKAEVARAGETLVVKPLTFMNESGQAIRLLSDFFKVPAEHCLIVYDDIALPFGQFRIRREGSAGGHNGVKSLIACLATQEFPRLRFGVGEAGASPLVSHVLGKFSKPEVAELPLLIDDAVAAVDSMLEDGIEAAMGKWNGKARPQS
ncbi:MAG: PTH1 family peptidyl-tRNA hydrolase [Verrucomicrobiales bacterium]|jgi:PTH1 family peptidyl-tRNA hydrolase